MWAVGPGEDHASLEVLPPHTSAFCLVSGALGG